MNVMDDADDIAPTIGRASSLERPVECHLQAPVENAFLGEDQLPAWTLTNGSSHSGSVTESTMPSTCRGHTGRIVGDWKYGGSAEATVTSIAMRSGYDHDVQFEGSSESP